MKDNVKPYAQALGEALIELCDRAHLQAGDVVVIGCSTSEVMGKTIGKDSAPEVGQRLFITARDVLKERGIYLAAQCCEHLNRALVMEKEAMADPSCRVNVRPLPKAGGSFATAAYEGFTNPVVVEHQSCDAGLDIGQTLIGMHLKSVAVPVRLQHRKIGEAILTAARVRPKYIGGPRAQYVEALM